MASTPLRLIALVAMVVIAVGAAWFALVAWLGVQGVWENNEDQADAGLYFLAGVLALGAAIGAVAGLWRRSRLGTAVAVLAQAASVIFVLLLGATSQQGFGEEDRVFLLILAGVLAADVLAGAAVAARERT